MEKYVFVFHLFEWKFPWNFAQKCQLSPKVTNFSFYSIRFDCLINSTANGHVFMSIFLSLSLSVRKVVHPFLSPLEEYLLLRLRNVNWVVQTFTTIFQNVLLIVCSGCTFRSTPHFEQNCECWMEGLGEKDCLDLVSRLPSGRWQMYSTSWSSLSLSLSLLPFTQLHSDFMKSYIVYIVISIRGMEEISKIYRERERRKERSKFAVSAAFLPVVSSSSLHSKAGRSGTFSVTNHRET